MDANHAKIFECAPAILKMDLFGRDHENVIAAAMKNSDRWENMKDEGFSDEEIKRAFNKESADESICMECKT